MNEKIIENIQIKEDNSFSTIKKDFWKKYYLSSVFSFGVYLILFIVFIVLSFVKEDNQYILWGALLLCVGVLWIVVEGFVRFSRMKKQFNESKSIVINLDIYEKHLEISELNANVTTNKQAYPYEGFDSIKFDEKKKGFIFKKKRGALIIYEADIKPETKEFLMGIRK